ncbi:MAG: DMT family transporter [Betaproteobacteria bacterium]|nr:DMT family transporter [Betaproteobacteria bacterium]
MTDRTSHRWGVLALLAVTVVWGTTFPAMKDLTAEVSPIRIVAVRFLIAALILSPLWRGMQKAEIKAGIMLGSLLFVAFMLQVEGLVLTSSNRSAFVTGLNVILVPLIGTLLGQQVGWRIALASGLALAGLLALFWEGASWNLGDTLTLGCALFYAIYIVLLEFFAHRHAVRSLRPERLAAVQSVALCGAGMLWLLLTEPVELPALAQQVQRHGVELIYLGVVASALMIWLQAWGQRRVRAVEAAILYGLEPVFAAIAAWFWLAEAMTVRALLGALLIVAGMIISQLEPDRTG